MIGMLMCVQHGMNDADAGPQELCSQVGSRVDQQIALGQTEHRAGTEALVPGIGTEADCTATADGRDADRGASAEQQEAATNIGAVVGGQQRKSLVPRCSKKIRWDVGNRLGSCSGVGTIRCGA